MPIVLSCGWDHKSFDGGKEVKGQLELPKKCPYCESGVLQRWGSYQRSYVVDGHDLKHQIKIVRMRCKCCGKTVAVLPEVRRNSPSEVLASSHGGSDCAALQ